VAAQKEVKQAKQPTKKVVSKKAATTPREKRDVKGPIGYFIGAWRELRQVHWPNRRATWGLTLAVILFSAVLATLIILLDLGFNELSKRILS
jgi:preprotein translocase SecE subunit